MGGNIADALRKWRDEVRLTQKEIAAKLGISDARYGNWERGLAEPPRRFLNVLKQMGFVPPGEQPSNGENPPYYQRTTPSQLRILIETMYDPGRDADLRAEARRELYRLLQLADSGSN